MGCCWITIKIPLEIEAIQGYIIYNDSGKIAFMHYDTGYHPASSI